MRKKVYRTTKSRREKRGKKIIRTDPQKFKEEQKKINQTHKKRTVREVHRGLRGQ